MCIENKINQLKEMGVKIHIITPECITIFDPFIFNINPRQTNEEINLQLDNTIKWLSDKPWLVKLHKENDNTHPYIYGICETCTNYYFVLYNSYPDVHREETCLAGHFRKIVIRKDCLWHCKDYKTYLKLNE